MPTVWRCTQCSLILPVGSYHYWPPTEPYGGTTLLACRACGCAHAIERSIHLPKVKDRFFHLGGPYIDDELPRNVYCADGAILSMKWYMGPPRLSEWDSGPELSTWGTIEPSCIHCGSQVLTDQWEDEDPCPSCQGRMQCVSFWGT
jgi:hypothetical protein